MFAEAAWDATMLDKVEGVLITNATLTYLTLLSYTEATFAASTIVIVLKPGVYIEAGSTRILRDGASFASKALHENDVRRTLASI